MPSLATHLVTTLQGVLYGRSSDTWCVEDRLDHIRQAMLDSLAHSGGLFLSSIERRVMFAPDAESLWYLRPELLTALAASDGEREARQKISGISALFDGLLPKGLVARPSLLR